MTDYRKLGAVMAFVALAVACIAIGYYVPLLGILIFCLVMFFGGLFLMIEGC